MGKGASKPTEQIELSLNHPRFTNAKFIVSEKQRLMQTVMGADNKEYDKWKERLEKQKPHSQFLLLPVKHDFASKGFCGNSGSLTLDFQDFPYLLTEQMAHRKGKKKLFEQYQLWYLLFALISAKKDMIPPFSKIGDVRPQNIFINDQGQVKIANLYSWPREITNFMKAFQKETTYLAPQQLKQLEMSVPESMKNDQSQLFSIGLTLLSAATFQDFHSAYDLNKYWLNESKINEALNQFKVSRAYSDIFKGVVCNLCEFDPEKRINPEELWTWISPHEQKIRQRQNFFIPSAPNKIHQEVLAIRQFNSGQIGTHLDSGVQGQKLNFPPPIVRTSVPQTLIATNPIYNYTAYSNIPTHMQAQSVYVPATGAQIGTFKPTLGTPDVTSTPIVSSSQNTSTNKKIGQPIVSANQPSSFAVGDAGKADTTSKKDVNAKDSTSAGTN